MNPGLVVKLRPTGPWRMGPDSGARNRVDAIYHSDSLYSAVTSAMARLGLLEEWLQATVGDQAPAVCFSSCFPFLDEIGFVVPPRTVWPPRSASLMSARVRWKSARFVPLDVVRAVLSGEPLDENQWSVDGDSECLVPAGRPGPFRTGIRWSAAVDRLTGSSERHSTACIEFRPGCGLWSVVGFHDEAAHTRWREPVKAAFRLLADTGFGGRRSRGWGRSEQPEFIEGSLPEMILPVPVAPIAAEAAPASLEFAHVEPQPGEPSPVPPIGDPPMEQPPATEPSPGEPPLEDPHMFTPAPAEPGLPDPDPDPQLPEPEPEPEPEPVPFPEPMTAVGIVGGIVGAKSHWLLSLFTPAPADSVDWARGNYAVQARGGRIDSPAGAGELKKQVQMVVEGSVLYADDAPHGAASDVAPDGFAHPVFRAGFALAIPLPGPEGTPS
jgi:CRISPR type III-A-associated RAMP protein Csm4